MLCYLHSVKTEFPNVTGYRDRHGQERWRFRKKGHPPYGFKSRYGTQAFRDEYEWLVGGQTLGRLRKFTLNSLRGVSLVYIVGTRAAVKIGRTTDIASRMVRFQTANLERLQLLAIMPGGAELEAELHKRFADARINGEWFKRTPEIRALIRDNPVGPWRTGQKGSTKSTGESV